MDRQKAWTHYFTTGDRTPLVKAYWKSIQTMAQEMFPYQQEDMAQIGMIGLLKAIHRLDRERVKSLDAWVFLNVRGTMFNARKVKPTDSLDLMLFDGPTVEDELFPYESLDVLPKREALILRLVHVEGYKRTEVAKMFGLSSMRIGQLEKRALARLEISLARDSF